MQQMQEQMKKIDAELSYVQTMCRKASVTRQRASEHHSRPPQRSVRISMASSGTTL